MTDNNPHELDVTGAHTHSRETTVLDDDGNDHQFDCCDCPNILDDDLYYGFIQALCWTVSSDGNNGLTFNEPDELMIPHPSPYGVTLWNRRRFLELFADLDDEGSIMVMRPIPERAWVIYSTESDDCPNFAEREELGLHTPGYWAEHLDESWELTDQPTTEQQAFKQWADEQPDESSGLT